MPKLANLELAVRQLKGAYRLIDNASNCTASDYEKGKLAMLKLEVSRAQYDAEEMSAARSRIGAR